MSDIRTKFKRAKEIRCEIIDEITESPQNRAKNVLNSFQKISNEIDNYDMLCFCTLYLASQLAIEPDFKKEVESLALKLNYNHYFSGSGIGLYDEDKINRIFNERFSAEFSNSKPQQDKEEPKS